MIKYFNGIPVSVNNTITKNSKEENYYISYNSSKRDYGVDTTALVITIGDNERQVFYILEGNHSAQYENCKDLKECISYFVNNKECVHKYSDRFEH
jgi:hypothetical protein